MSDFLVVQGNPCNSKVAPYFALLLAETGSTANSIYRGQDAAEILHRHGKHSQTELYEQGYPANRPGASTHELFSDAVAYAGPVGRKLEWWQQGIDVNDRDVERMIAAAKEHGWELFQPYKSGSEYHHLNFRRRPRPHSLRCRLKLIRLRHSLPRK